MTAFAGRFNTESPGQVSQALDGCSRGLDFADALHLAASAADEGMFNFDAQFVDVAAAAGMSVHLAGGLQGRAGACSFENQARPDDDFD